MVFPQKKNTFSKFSPAEKCTSQEHPRKLLNYIIYAYLRVSGSFLRGGCLCFFAGRVFCVFVSLFGGGPCRVPLPC